MSLSVPSWQEKFPKDVTPDETNPDYCKNARAKDECVQAWNKWKKAAAALKHPGSFPTKALQTAAKLTSPAGAAARLAIANLLEQANSLRTEYSINVRPEITAAKQVQRGTIQHAIFAKAGDSSAPGKRCAAELQTDRLTSCKADKAAATVCVRRFVYAQKTATDKAAIFAAEGQATQPSCTAAHQTLEKSSSRFGRSAAKHRQAS
ncbi:variant surface glycoprotein [Trypanosoma brucei equiperdum]|uniref:Variant surface glycoprotein n=1 Tax=Trypanosoma brucei equiperdum TaxID=630700 RepID=A0A3L6LCV9_9TRYP|nr:variant surface glycoprotein [Trypanosoma brucei equiperdum]